MVPRRSKTGEKKLANKSLIEESFPIRSVSEESVREKSTRQGSVSSLHIWWARRPLSASRSTIYSALTEAPEDEKVLSEKISFVSKLSLVDSINDYDTIKSAIEDIRKSNHNKTVKVLDPFSGGGSIPLEALRLGCEVDAVDYNPVATLTLKGTLEFPQKFGQKLENLNNSPSDKTPKVSLQKDFRFWSNWVLKEAKKEMAPYYPSEEDGYFQIGYIWARTIPCLNPTCGAEIPLMRQLWLVRKEKRRVALYPYVSAGNVQFKLVGTGYEEFPNGFDPSKGTVSRAIATCIVCGYKTDDETTRSLFRNGKSSEKLIAVVLHKENETGKRYRIADDFDISIFDKAKIFLANKIKEYENDWKINPIPDEPLVRVPVSFGVINVWVYGTDTWGKLFNDRQKLALIILSDKVRKARVEMQKAGYGIEYTNAIVTYLAFIVSRIADFSNNLCHWHPQWEFIPNVFARQALPMGWDYAELNVFSPVLTGTFESMQRQIGKVITTLSNIEGNTVTVSQGSALNLAAKDNYYDAVFTDPPYYDNVPYSYLSDFFYVWLKRMLKDVYPDLFATPLTPKNEEVVAYSSITKNGEDGKTYFEKMLGASFKEIHRVLKINGISIIVYAHQSIEGWETLVNSLLSSGLVVTSTWPIHTEMKDRLRSKDSAALASSIYIVCRKLERKKVGFYTEILNEIDTHLNKKLEHLWKDGISGADFLIAAIGSSIEIFGSYEEIIDDQGSKISTSQILEEVRKIVTNFAVKQVLHNGFATEIESMTRFYIIWRWAYGNLKAPFDEARKLGQSLALDISSEWHKGLIKKDKEFISVLGPEERNVDKLEKSNELIDVLHYVLIQWKLGHSDKLDSKLRETGYGSREIFYKVAQAISETLPKESSERKLIEGFLTGKERIIREMRKEVGQRRLF